MLIVFLFALSALRVNGLAKDEHGSRRPKQLDLQDIRTPVNEDFTTTLAPLRISDEVLNGNLSPVSPVHLPANIVGAHSQQTFDFQSANALEKETGLCKPPYDLASCSPKGGSPSGSRIPEPSRDLVPPFNDLEEEKAFPTVQDDREVKTTAETQREFVTTTQNLVTRASEQIVTRIASKSLRPQVSAGANAFPSKAEATNELRSYLPPQPEFSAAAQTNVAVVQPAKPKDDHDHDHHDHHDHHHGHHHGENFNICDDAFHAFLCAPLKARKRITGAFPSSLKGQSSFVNYQKLLPNPERQPAPSNTFQNAYLPPERASSSSSSVQSTHLPPLTTKRPVVTTTTAPPPPPPRFIPQPSNSNDRLYLPPLSDYKIAAAPSDAPILRFAEIKFPTTTRPSVISTIQTSSSIRPLFLQTSQPIITGSSLTPVSNSLSVSENRFYLPPDPSPQPAASIVSTATNIYSVNPTISPQPSVFVSLPSTTTLGPSPSNSFLITSKPTPQFIVPIISTTAQPSTKKKPPTPHVPQTTAAPFIQTFASQPSNSILHHPQTPKPLPSAKTPSFQFTQQSSNEDRSYLPPDPKETAAAQISSAAVAPSPPKNPFHHGRDLCTDPFHSFLCVSAKPRKRITGQLPPGVRPESSNSNESRLRPDSSNQDENRVRPEKPLEGAPAQNLGYTYPKPSSPFPTPSTAPPSTAPPTTGYSYPKPDKAFPLPSQQNFRFASSTTAKPEPRPSEARVLTGYQYPKPEKPFPPPAEQTKVTTTSSPSTGYSYPKPQKLFPLPTEQKETRQKPKQTASPTTQGKGYQYPKPDQSLKLPGKTSGYSYPKPTKRLELPTENRFKLPLSQGGPSLDPLGALGSADFIPVNKIDYKRSESKLVAGLRRFGERQRKRQRAAELTRSLGE